MNIVGCAGDSSKLRQTYLSQVESGIRPFEWLQLGRWELPTTTVLCAANSLSRVSVHREAHAAQLYVGSVRRKNGIDENRPFSGLEGDLHLAVANGEDGSCSIAVDALGLFPLYYSSTPEFLLFSSSLWPFGKHPNLSPELDLDGLIGLFLSLGTVGGRTLLRGVTRLSPGYAVTWRPGQLAVEQAVNRFSPTTDLFDATLDEQVEAVDSVLRSATTRQDAHMLLLSGGLDSRLLAGYLSTTHGADFQAVSLGSTWQYDVTFARQVASRLGWRHRALEVDTSRFRDHALIQARHEQLVGGFADLGFWQLVTDLGPANPALVAGFCGNNVLEPLWPMGAEFTFARLFELHNKYGFSPATLQTLIRGENLDERIAGVVERLRGEYDSVECEPFQKAFMFGLSHRARFQVGAVPWRLSFGVQCALPYVDPAVIRTALALPAASLRGRQLQRILLCRRFPELARLPLDTATFFTRPLLPTFGDRVRHLSLLAYHGLLSRRERRYYHSVFDLNGPGWRDVRAEAEKSRAKAEAVLDRDRLRELLPPPDREIRTGASDFFHEGSRKKILLAFMLWASEHL